MPATSATCSGTPTTTPTSGGRRASIAGTCSASTTSTTCRSGGTHVADEEPARRLADLGSSFFRTGTPFSITRTNDIAGVGDGGNGQPVDLVGDLTPTRTASSRRAPRQDDKLRLQPGGVRQPSGRHVRELDPQHRAEPGRPAVGPGDLQELHRHRHAEDSVPRGDVQLHQPPEPERAADRHHQRNFGRAITKDGNRRDIQLALRYLF